ncbi:MAG: hypothetical protein JXQ73_23255 [Phycisphaerae bacterium]|nr:hypothetical protein [Phycisphaerae bacterium]
MRIDGKGIHYRELNERIHVAVEQGEKHFELDHICGHRYIGAGLDNGVQITINGVPGNDLGAFMNGATIIVSANGQDGVGNTMNEGKIVIHGDAGDILGHSMRGGKVFVRGYVGYRAGIHMKAYGDRFPVVVVGRKAGDYFGEYMAGGVLVVLGLDGADTAPVGRFVGTGMHGGVIYVRGKLEPHQLGAEVGVGQLGDSDWTLLTRIIAEYGQDFDLDPSQFLRETFVKLAPKSSRPYGNLYAY